MSEKPLRVIHVGTGGRGRWPLDVVAADARFESVALVDINPNHLAAARQKTGLPESVCFGDTAQAAQAVEADLVVGCAPTVMHAPIARAAFEAGLHALVEKGMTLEWSLARRLVQEAEQAGSRFCVSQNYRYNRVEQTIKSMLGTEAYGDAEFMDVTHHRYRPEPRTLNYQNAMMWDMSCHHFDNLNFFLGRPKTAIGQTYGASWSKYAPHDANISAVITYESGAVCAYTMTHVAQNSFYRAFFHTTTGTIRAYDVGGVEFRPINSGAAESVPLVQTGRSEQGVMDDFYRYIAEGVEPGISGRNNLDTLAVIEACARSHERRAMVDIAELFEEPL